MRQLVSTAIVALIVGTLAGATVSALAQEPEAVVPAAGSRINADRVDGRHAVGAGATRAARAGKLVATDSAGYLPANIVKNLVTKVTLTTVVGEPTMIGPGEDGPTAAHCPMGSFVTGGGFSVSEPDDFALNASSPGDMDWFVNGKNTGQGLLELRARAVCMSVEPSAAFSTAHVGRRPVVRDK